MRWIARVDQLSSRGLPDVTETGVVFGRDLIGTLRRRELEARQRLAAETG